RFRAGYDRAATGGEAAAGEGRSGSHGKQSCSPGGVKHGHGTKWPTASWVSMLSTSAVEEKSRDGTCFFWGSRIKVARCGADPVGVQLPWD
ncbi:MAG TPA: hypothetical protein DFR83_18140, partial [Deltaproteobacteria bacterium]|nr:hypothetical protein [Deltaproteobacteria bacterium]